MGPQVDTVVVGAGVVGLAIARAFAIRGDEVVVLEAESSYGHHASSRNSEVVHAGLYYPPGSLKARLCNAGRPLLLEYCRARDIGHRVLGKLIVATNEAQRDTLHAIEANAIESGGAPVHTIDATQVARREPSLRTCGALWSPQTAIVDSHAFMHSLSKDAQDHGAAFAWQRSATRIETISSGFRVHTKHESITTRRLINTAGHGARALALTLGQPHRASVPPCYFAKGSYARLRGPSPCTTLVYPVPEDASLGVHLTVDLDGNARFGPDQQWIDDFDYTPDPSRVDAFYEAIRRYWPALPDDALHIDYAGIRVKVQAPGTPAQDFVVRGPLEHGIEGLVELFGIESPGLTSSLALADLVLSHLSF